MRLPFIFLLICAQSFSQEFSNPDLQDLINAERSFSLLAKEKNTRDAFLYFLDENAVTAAPGNGPRVGKKYLEEQKSNESWLWWQPSYSDIAASGDFGFNIGPWEFRQNKNDEKPVAFGTFISMWKKNTSGEWKVVIDIGISHTAPKNKRAPTTSAHKPVRPSLNTIDKDAIVNLEKKFIHDFAQKGNDAYASHLSDEVQFFRAGNEPFMSPDEVREFLNKPVTKITYTCIDGDMATSGDLAYVYGKASVETFKDGTPQSSTHSYMRFWKKEDGNWKIIVDVLSN